MPSITAICNFYREPLAMPGWLEMAKAFFDDVVCVSSPPSDAPPDEQTIGLVKAAGVRLVHTTIDAGYGIVRTRCLREAKTEWVFILDADERFHPIIPLMRCEGTEAYPAVKEPNLSTHIDQPSFNQGDMLRQLLTAAGGKDAMRLSRRHWFSPPGDFTKPCQPWGAIPDWQLRLVRNSPFLYYEPERKMHEWLRDSRTQAEPAWHSGTETTGPFIEHHHFWAKSADPEGRALALQTYERLDKVGTENMWTRTGFDPVEV